MKRQTSVKRGNLKVRDGSAGMPIFIHSELDEYGLSPVEFRVYARIARRAGANGKHSESIPNMAHEFEICPRTVQYALRLLTTCGLISRHVRPGRTDEYSLNPRSRWRDKADLKKLRQQNVRSGGATTDRGAMRDRGVVQPQHGVVVQPETDEGTPFEGTPKELSAHARLMAFHAKHLEGKIPDGSAQSKAVKWLLEQTYTPQQCEACYVALSGQKWRETAVTWLTVKKEIGSWLKRDAEARAGFTETPQKILTDNGDEYTVLGPDGTPSKRWRTAEAFARDSRHPPEEVLAKWN
jgi:hypothetical protein